MQKNLTELVFIIDRSGSMTGLESDTIGGFNSMINKQKKIEGDALVTTVLFNHEYKMIHDRVDLKEIKLMEEKDYVPGGSTALIDALGDAIKHIKEVHKYIREEDVPGQTIFTIITDGYENASHKYSSEEVKKMIKEQREKDWEFIFLGANIDAVETAKSYGMKEDLAFNYNADSKGTRKAYAKMNCCLYSKRTVKDLED